MIENEFYSRQINLKEVGEQGQRKINNARVLIIGAGGLGHPAGQYLAAFGIGHLGVLDFDKIELSNLNRQVLFSINDVGASKSKVLADKLSTQNPFIEIETVAKKLTSENAEEIISQFDIILDCCDNYSTKFLIHDTCWFLKKDLVQASVYQYEGQIQTFPFSKEINNGCLRCLWGEIPSPSCTGTCAQVGIIGAVAGTLGSLQAMEAVKLILDLEQPEALCTTTVNLLNLETKKIKWKKDKACPLCSSSARIKTISKDEYQSREKFELSGLSHDNIIFVDIREDHELEKDKDERRDDYIHWPLSQENKWIEKIEKDSRYLFLCSKGIRSYQLVSRLQSKGMNNCFSLFGGLENYESSFN